MEYPKLTEAQDRRRKIPSSEHETIKRRREAGESWRAIAKTYGVDKRLIMFIVHPERLAAAKKNRDWRKYYDKKAHANYMRSYRNHKKEAHGEAWSQWRSATRTDTRQNQIHAEQPK